MSFNILENFKNMRGYIHLYTGNGKGKTTSAFGLALRAVGAGKKVFFAQFVKGKKYSETKAINRYLPNITVKQFGRGCFIINQPEQADIDAAQKGLAVVASILLSGSYEMVVLDEVTIAIYYKLFSSADLIEVLNRRHEDTEVILTGRYATADLIDLADLVTEMKEIKHYYNKGIEARKGIEF